jgi:hypothetical protein
MTEDSGAFKTNPANSRPISAFVTIGKPGGNLAAPAGKRIFGIVEGHWRIRFLTSTGRPLRYS